MNRMTSPAEAGLQSRELDELTIARAREIVLKEAAGLQVLAGSLGPEITAAVRLIEAQAGRLIVSGVGKSGHIGAKLAATFASTGTPSFFVHAAEATHGDLGMVLRGDTVLAISKSGSTRELYPLLDYCTDNGIPVIAITGEPDSRLGRAATIVLKLPDVDEVCPNNLAPTTSATLMLVMGHVMAVLLMDSRKFAHADFAQFHPGGRLGRRLSTIRRYMEEYGTEVPKVSVDAPIEIVISQLTGGRMGCVVVCEPGGDALRGIITEGDLRRAISPELFQKQAGDIMTSTPHTVTADELIVTAIELMATRRIANVIVVADGKPIDVIHMKDLLERGYV